MEQLRHLPRTVLLPAIALLAVLLALAFTRSERLGDLVENGAMSSLVSIGIGLTVAAFLISRVSARR
jgi:hypothetical protein